MAEKSIIKAPSDSSPMEAHPSKMVPFCFILTGCEVEGQRDTDALLHVAEEMKDAGSSDASFIRKLNPLTRARSS